MKVLLILLFALNILCRTNSAKILGVFPLPAPSHYILGHSLMQLLSEKGHDVTIITPYEEKNTSHGNYKEVFLAGFKEEAEKMRQKINHFEKQGGSPFLYVTMVNILMAEVTEKTLNNSNVQKLINSNETFDVVIVEQFMNDALKAFALLFKAPLILFSTIGANAWVNLPSGNPAPPSYIPAVFLSYSSNMTLFQRTVNSLMVGYNFLVTHFYTYPTNAKLVKKYFPKDLELNQILYNASIVLLNSHPSTNQPVPYVPNMIDIGGFHVKPPKKLPLDLQKFLDEARNGVIYFSMGSNLRSVDLPSEKRNVFLKTFSKLKQKVLWKWEDEVLPEQPSNVKLGKWLPQQDILAHPNVKLFITHGGLLSTTETVYHGVPVLAIPIFGDQMINAQNIVNNGYGLMLNYHDISEELLTKQLDLLLNDAKYTNNAKSRSKIFHDRLNSPQDTAVYWVEYVIRHGGAPHLRVTALDLHLHQYLLLDVLFLLVLFVLILVYVCRKSLNLLCSNTNRKNKIKIN